MITTERFSLRPFEPKDYEAYLSMLANPEPKVPWRQVMSPEDAWHRLVRHAGHWALFGYGVFAIFEREHGLFLGETGLWTARRGMGAIYDACDETGWAVVPSWHGRSVAFEAADAVHKWYDAKVGRRRTVCMIDPANHRSIQIARKLGYAAYDDGIYKGKPVSLFERSA
ncbi:GNAT family N-acetyltransferase [Nostoc sp. 3335mG]|nr:GNAT family N-acetyltransferase [Nostoc sp. 3335mG]